MALLRSIASWATTGVITVGAAAGIVLPNIEAAPPALTAVTVINNPVKGAPKTHVTGHSFVALTASVKVHSTNVRTPVRRERRRNHPVTVTISTTTVPDSTSTSSVPVTTTVVTTTTAPPDVITTLPPATTTTGPPAATTTTFPHHGGDGGGSADT